MAKIIRKIAVIGFFVFSFLCIGDVYSQGPPAPPGGGSDPPCWPPPCVPIDGGIGFLLVAGALYGSKKLLDSRKKENII